MSSASDAISIYLERGKRRVFAGAIDWPGWCRSGRDDDAAMAALLVAAPRYAQMLDETSLAFSLPTDVEQFAVVEQLAGSASTDFGAPDAAPAADDEPLSDDLQRFKALLRACWNALDEAAKKAEGHALRKGPHGGGRELDAIIAHVVEADVSYLARIGRKVVLTDPPHTADARQQGRAAMLEGLEAGARGELPALGPRGGKRWTARYFVRRVAWHTLDHVWEIEDRVDR